MADESTEVFATFDDLEAHFQKENAFDPTEMFNILKVLSVEAVPMPERMLETRGIKFDSPEFKEIFPHGVPCIKITCEGVDVEYDFGNGNKIDNIIEMVSYQGKNIGKPKGEGSKLHITNQAFEDVLGHPLFGAENRKALVGKIARFGQHIGSGDIEGQRRTWRWDVPREDLGEDFVYTGDVRKVTGRAQSAAGGATAGVEELSEEDAVKAILEIVVGKPADTGDEITADVMSISGLTQKWAAICMADELLKSLFDEEYIDSAGGLIAAKDKAKALLAA